VIPDLDRRFRDAVQFFWDARARQADEQAQRGSIDAGTRGAVTGGTQMGAIDVLITDILLGAGLDRLHVHTGTALELPGYYRPEKQWDLLVVADGQLVLAIELKSHVGPSFGNNTTTASRRLSGTPRTSGPHTARAGWARLRSRFSAG
jgi:hypothetical protein